MTPARRRSTHPRAAQPYRSPFRSAEVFEIEEVIDPRETRPILCRWANLVAPSRRPGTMAWTFRPELPASLLLYVRFLHM